MIRIEGTGRVRIIGHDNEHVVNFQQREAELRFARILTSANVHVVPDEKAAGVTSKSRRATKDLTRRVEPTDGNETRRRGHRGSTRSEQSLTRSQTPKVMPCGDFTAILAERVLGWKATPDRFALSERRWTPRWRFRPTTNLEDAFRLLRAAKSLEFSIRSGEKGIYRVHLRTTSKSIEVTGSGLPLVICMAVACAYGIVGGE
jgi:hypothetical protein